MQTERVKLTPAVVQHAVKLASGGTAGFGTSRTSSNPTSCCA